MGATPPRNMPMALHRVCLGGMLPPLGGRGGGGGTEVDSKNRCEAPTGAACRTRPGSPALKRGDLRWNQLGFYWLLVL